MGQFSEKLDGIVNSVNGYLTDYVLIFLLIGMGLYFTIRTRFVQVRCFGEGWRRLFSNLSLNSNSFSIKFST
ncbi:MAG: hypothetical protein MJ078_09145, partial [Clostridia bacterium]|nr:hypothetical protein [Clostridia bacterium]